MGKAAGEIGWLMARTVCSPAADLPGLLLNALPPVSERCEARMTLIRGVLQGVPDSSSLLKKCKPQITAADFVRLLLLAPFRRSTWLLVDELEASDRVSYWNDVIPDFIRDVDDENPEAVERLLAAHRPRAAFACAHLKLETLGPDLLFRLLSAILQESGEPSSHYRLRHYDVEKAFHILDSSSALTLDQKASLEFSYIDALVSLGGNESYGIPNLEKYIEGNPGLFVQVLVWVYKRGDDGEDPSELRAPLQRVDDFARRGYTLLHTLGRIPGNNGLGELKAENLAEWIKTVRDSARELGRLDAADASIGRLLATAPDGADRAWPCEPVRQVMEDVRSKKMMSGARNGLYNSRGVVARGERGDQERELVAKYRGWAAALQYSHPFVATELLLRMAETYENEAKREDTEADIRVRLR